MIIEIAVEVLHETDQAILVTDGNVEEWIPKSLIEDQVGDGMEIETIFIPEYIALDKGLI